MANIPQLQAEAMAVIDTGKALVDKVASIIGLLTSPPSISFATNPIGFLLQMLSHMGVSYEQLQTWLTNFLVYVTPLLEVSVKTVLLTNLKSMVSCSIDPRIPEKFRKRHVDQDDDDSSMLNGFDVSIESIDFLDKLSVSPLSDEGSDWYFGLEGVEDSYKFARAEDFDAFLWYVIHKGKYPSPSKITSVEDFKNVYGANNVNGETLLETLDIQFTKDKPSTILLGNTFTYETSGDSKTISVCIDRQYDDENNIIQNTIVPVSDDWNSTNWYARGGSQVLNYSLGLKKNVSRDYSKERGLCNFQYIDQASSDSPITGLVNNKLRISILPKPVVHIPNIAAGEPPWRFKKLLFNSKGEYDPQKGKYTIIDNTSEISDSNDLEYLGGLITIDAKSGEVTVGDKNALMNNLIECYPGLTVYEFNFDYVMSIKLFDAKVLATSLLDSLINTKVGVNLSIQRRHQEATEAIKEVVKKIINSDGSTVSDCFFTFDNSKYDELLRKAEQKRANQQPFGNTTKNAGTFDSVHEILNEYDSNADLNIQVDVLNRVITQAAVTISEGVDAKDTYDVQLNFVSDLIENLVQAIVEALLSPKLMILLEINQQLMGGTWEKFSLSDIMKAMLSMISSIVQEIVDLVIQELLKLLLEVLNPIVETLGNLLLREQIESYADVIQDIIRNCPIIWFNIFGKNQYEDSALDTVDYADIDTTQTGTTEAPLSTNC